VRCRAAVAILAAAAALLAACGREASAPAPPAARDVTVMTVAARDVPVHVEFVAQTQSSREVEIRARVEGFLDKRLYTEGAPVRAGQVLFQIDRQPFEAALQSARGQLAQQQARWDTAKANLARVRPLVQQNAMSRKSLDDATGEVQQAAAAVLAAQGEVRSAQLNLGYTTIRSPLTGLSSFARKQEGSFVAPGEAGLLTVVSQIDPIWVNFSMSENEFIRLRDEVARGTLQPPPGREYEVEVILADGSSLPNRGRISFADPSFSKDTGTFLVRAELANARGELKPGQFVRARIHGAVRPNAVLVPQRAVLQGPKSHYVWVVTGEGAAQQRAVQVGDWHGDDWFISQGLRPGETVVVDGAIRVVAGAPLQVSHGAAAGGTR
jgi:membrane fusion protein (multidrug efflux system)